jgi:copper chaperone NosL
MRRAFAVAALIACTTSHPVEPVWNKQPCAHCAMVMSDTRFGAQLVAENDHTFFDDVGCMVAFMGERGASGRAWVKDAQTGKWLDARSARYISASSPMDYGFEARAEGGVAWDEMKAAVLAKRSAR